MRRNNPFELFVVDNEKKYLENTKKNFQTYKKKFDLINKNHFIFSRVNMCIYNGRISTEYTKLPICNPDFIYLDGPDKFNIKGSINGINLKHNDMMPMANDLLKLSTFNTWNHNSSRWKDCNEILRDHFKENGIINIMPSLISTYFT